MDQRKEVPWASILDAFDRNHSERSVPLWVAIAVLFGALAVCVFSTGDLVPMISFGFTMILCTAVAIRVAISDRRLKKTIKNLLPTDCVVVLPGGSQALPIRTKGLPREISFDLMPGTATFDWDDIAIIAGSKRLDHSL